MYLGRLLCILFTCSVVATQAYDENPQTNVSNSENVWTINQKNSDIREFIAQIATITGDTFVLDPQIKDTKTISVISSKALKKSEVYDVFLEALNANGYAVIPKGKVKTIVPNNVAKSAGGNKYTQQSAGATMVTKVIDLHSVSAIEVIPIIRPLIAAYGHAAASATGNTVVVSDSKNNVERISELIKELDNASNIDYEVIQLEYAWVGDIVKLIQENMTMKGPTLNQLQVIADERSNRIVLKGNESKRQRARKLIETLDQKGARHSSTRVIFLNHGDAENIATILSEAAQSIGGNTKNSIPIIRRGGANLQSRNNSSNSDDVFIKADKTTNSLVMIADPDTLLELEKLVHQLDVRRAQVLIQAAIVEVSGNIDDSIGLQWGIGGTNTRTGNTVNPNSVVGAPLPPLSIGQVALRNSNFGVIINALQTNKNSDLLSTPSMLTLDNEEAEFMVGQEVPFTTGSYTTGTDSTNPFQTTERKDVGLTLKVTPHIGKNDTLRLKIEQNISALLPRSQQTAAAGDVTSQRKIKATIVVDNEQTIVLGGLLQDDVKQTVQKVPFLGDIPLLGYLFRNSAVIKEKRNLLLFIRPSIVRSSSDMRKVTEDHYSTLRLIHSGQSISPLNSEYEMPENPAMLFKRKVYNSFNSEE